MKKALILLALLWSGHAWATACPVTTGAITLNVTQPRTSGISPLLAFFDATTTTTTATLGGAGTVFQDVYFAWNFGDSGVSGGTNTWPAGANGQPLKNVGTGPVAAHLYVTGGSDTTYTAQVWAKVVDATTHVATVATCTVQVTAFDPSGANGFTGANTTCIAATATPVAGSGGCPAGAGVAKSSTIGTGALSTFFGSGKRVLFKCGDTFTGTYSISNTVNKASIGAYGGCQNTQTSRPIFQNSGGTTLNVTPNNPTDIRITDIDFEDGTGSANAITHNGGMGEEQITIYNNNCGGMFQCFYENQVYQGGLIQNQMTSMKGIGNFWNYAENNCVNGSTSLNCTTAGTGNCSNGVHDTLPTGGTYCSVRYNAILGNSFDGTGAVNGGTGNEVMRVMACRYCVISNNTFKNANTVGSVLKHGCGNTFGSKQGANTWIGQYCEYEEVSDNLFTGANGGNEVELAPQDNLKDEHERFQIVERNLFAGTGGGSDDLLISGNSNVTIRNNVFYVTVASIINAMQVAARSFGPGPTAVEVYNNTCYTTVTISECVNMGGQNGAPSNSFASNTLFYNNGSATGSAVVNSGTGNTVSNNTTNNAANPSMKNGSGNFSLLSDFLPTANATGATSAIPNYFDAFQLSWTSVYQLGALSQGAP